MNGLRGCFSNSELFLTASNFAQGPKKRIVVVWPHSSISSSIEAYSWSNALADLKIRLHSNKHHFSSILEKLRLAIQVDIDINIKVTIRDGVNEQLRSRLGEQDTKGEDST